MFYTIHIKLFLPGHKSLELISLSKSSSGLFNWSKAFQVNTKWFIPFLISYSFNKHWYLGSRNIAKMEKI